MNRFELKEIIGENVESILQKARNQSGEPTSDMCCKELRAHFCPPT